MKNKRYSVISFLVLLLVLSLLYSCDDSGSKCKGDPNYMINQISVKWYINGTKEENSFESGSYDTCYDVDAVYSHLVLTGPNEFLIETDVLCNSMQWLTYDDSCNKFPVGTYYLDFYFTDTDGTPISDVISMNTTMSVSGENINFDVLAPLDVFDATFTGTMYYDVTWDGATCEDSSPLVDNMTFELYDEYDNMLTDFSYAGQCINEQDIRDIPTGNYTVKIQGFDVSANPLYCRTFSIKLGAKLNPTFTFDVTSDSTDCM